VAGLTQVQHQQLRSSRRHTSRAYMLCWFHVQLCHLWPCASLVPCWLVGTYPGSCKLTCAAAEPPKPRFGTILTPLLHFAPGHPQVDHPCPCREVPHPPPACDGYTGVQGDPGTQVSRLHTAAAGQLSLTQCSLQGCRIQLSAVMRPVRTVEFRPSWGSTLCPCATTMPSLAGTCTSHLHSQ
jgi:hypothetical protein